MHGGRRRGPSRVRAMQIFHELKQRFPTVPDHVVTGCIQSSLLDQMGHHPPEAMNTTPPPKRPDTLDLCPDDEFARKLRPSEKCNDVHKLLNSPGTSDKPPRAPRLPPAKKETASTPSQTTDTLLNNDNPSPGVSLSFNVNLVQCSTSPKCSTTLQLTPTQPWLTPAPATSPRSFTSVNLTLRPPTAAPQDPIDITSENSRLTYSTSSFDREKGLQSRLQITVGPGGGSVASTRARPRSSYVAEEEDRPEVPARAGSLNNLSLAGKSEAPVLLKQQARIERMRIELRTEKAKLLIMKEEVAQLERDTVRVDRLTDVKVEQQLLVEIKHLRFQCEELDRADKGQFYNNIYTGPTGPLAPAPNRRPQRRPPQPRADPPPPEPDGPRWSCHLCTFLNHPDLGKCEQCEMPRVVHGTPRRGRRRLSGPFPASGIALDMIKQAGAVSLAALNFDVPAGGGEAGCPAVADGGMNKG